MRAKHTAFIGRLTTEAPVKLLEELGLGLGTNSCYVRWVAKEGLVAFCDPRLHVDVHCVMTGVGEVTVTIGDGIELYFIPTYVEGEEAIGKIDLCDGYELWRKYPLPNGQEHMAKLRRCSLCGGVTRNKRIFYQGDCVNFIKSGYLCDNCILNVRILDKTKGNDICVILKTHWEMLQDDPERLTTEFLKEMLGESAKECGD